MENKDLYFNFLEELRRSGITNMYGATEFLTKEQTPEDYGWTFTNEIEALPHSQAVEILKEWMKNYSELAKRLGWNNETAESSVEADNDDYYSLFDNEVSKDTINLLLKQLAEENKMSELNNAEHVWYIDELPFVVLYKDGNVKFLSQTDRITFYDNIDEVCSDFGLDLDKTIAEIKDKTDMDVTSKAELESPADDADEIEPIDYGTDEIVADDFEQEEGE